VKKNSQEDSLDSSKTYKDLIIITSRFPYPLEKGDKLRVYHQIRHLSKYFKVHLISTPDNVVKSKHKKQLEPYCESINIFQINVFQKIGGLLYSLLTNKPFQVGYFYHFGIHRKIKKLLHVIEPDHIYCQLIRSAEYVKDYHDCHKTIDYMDAFSKGMERLSQSNKGLKRFLYNSEAKRLVNYENTIFDYFENHTIISNQDQKHIFHKDNDSITIIPNGIDDSFLNYEKEVEKDCDIIFIGSMSYSPNIAAAKYIVNDILPLLPTNTKVKISGANPSRQVLKLASENVDITGFLEDIKAAYKSAKIFVAPMFLSVGLQNKLLEAMALGLPCITTSLSNNAIQAEPNKEILIANSPQEFKEKISVLLNDEELYNRLQKNATQFVKENYDWNKITHRLVTILND